MYYCLSDLNIDKIIGAFTDSVDRFCHTITVQNNDLAEQPGRSTLMIVNATLETTQFETQSATIDVMDDDCKLSTNLNSTHVIWTILIPQFLL